MSPGRTILFEKRSCSLLNDLLRRFALYFRTGHIHWCCCCLLLSRSTARIALAAGPSLFSDPRQAAPSALLTVLMPVVLLVPGRTARATLAATPAMFSDPAKESHDEILTNPAAVLK